MNSRELWISILPQLELSLSPGKYSTWILPIRAASLIDLDEKRSILEINCPSIFHKNQLEDKYLGQIQELAQALLKKKCEIKLAIRQEEKKPQKETGDDLFSIDSGQVMINAYKESVAKAGLNPYFTFENFAVSSSNEVAHAAVKTAAKNPGQIYHLVFIYGGVGVGKTHLMQAAGHEIIKKNPGTPLIYCSGEEFTNEIIEAIRNKTTPAFRQKYRKAGVLLLDDVQFIGGKEAVQEEFFHTFNAINKEGGQIVLTSDRLPSEIKGLEDRLRSRFEGGLTVDIQAPGFELRAAIILIKAQQMKMDLPMRVAQAIAANVESVRKLEGILLRLNSEQAARKEPLTEDLVMALLGKIGGEAETLGKRLSAKEVLGGVADYYQIKIADLKGERRLKKLAFPRQIVMYLLRKELQLPLEEVGFLLGGRDHTTIMHGQEKISNLLTVSENLRMDVSSIRKKLYKEGG